MLVHIPVVRALMALRRIDEATLANLANVSPPLLTKWLNTVFVGEDSEAGDALDASDAVKYISFKTQLEIVQMLGMNGGFPRNDIVHYWHVHEPLMSRSPNNYWALKVLTDAFGKADVVYFAKESDPLVSTHSTAHFGLQFSSFKAVLEATSNPLRNVGFDPEQVGMQWAPGNFGVLVELSEFSKLAPGLMTPLLFDSQLNVGKEMLAWERLNLLARGQNIGAAQIEQLLLGAQQPLSVSPALPVSVSGPPCFPVAPRVEPVVAPVGSPNVSELTPLTTEDSHWVGVKPVPAPFIEPTSIESAPIEPTADSRRSRPLRRNRMGLGPRAYGPRG